MIWALVRLYAAAIVLGIWATVWALNIRGDEVIGVFLGALTVAAVVAERERQRLRRALRDR